MTTSASFRSVSLCQRYAASWPNTSCAAWNASSSQLLPGKTTMPNRIRDPFQRLALPGPPDRPDPRASLDLNPIALDHRICEHFGGDFRGQRARLARFGGREVELEVLALPHVLDASVAERLQGVGNRAALGIEHRRLQRHEHARTHRLRPSPAPAGKRDRRYRPRASTDRPDRTRARWPPAAAPPSAPRRRAAAP